MTLHIIFHPYHSVRTILSIPFCPIPFCPYTILSIPFRPYHFVQYHFVRIPFCPYHYVRTILSATILSGRLCMPSRTLGKRCSVMVLSSWSVGQSPRTIPPPILVRTFLPRTISPTYICIMHTYMYMYAYTHKHTYTHTYTHIRTYILHTYIYTHTYICVCKSA